MPVFSRPLLTVTNASKISFETLSASIAVSTKYIIAIIFCRGVSLVLAMTLVFRFESLFANPNVMVKEKIQELYLFNNAQNFV